jgi:hypothetical protein
MHHQPDLEQAILDLEWMQRAMALQRVELYINLLLMPLSLLPVPLLLLLLLPLLLLLGFALEPGLKVSMCWIFTS